MVHLHEDDGFAVMSGFPDGRADAIITDPPYGTTSLPWDRRIDYAGFWARVTAVTKPSAVVVVFCAQPMMTDLINSNRTQFRYELIWHKTSPVGFLDANKRPLRAHENIAVFCRQWRGARNTLTSTYHPQFWKSTPYRKAASDGTRAQHYGAVRDMGRSSDGRRYPIDVLTFANRVGGTSPHPTAKPVELLRWLIATYTDPGDCVIDPFMGAGSTGVAAVELGRSFVGIERDAGYFAIAQERIETAYLAWQGETDLG